MHIDFADPRTRVLFAGVAVAVTTGLSAGQLMRPVLAQSAPPMQAVLTASAPPATSYAGVWTGSGSIPNYVIGTDWSPRDIQDAPVAQIADPGPAEEGMVAPPLPYMDSAYDEPTPERPSYPSEDGDILAGVRIVQPPEAPTEDLPAA